MAAYIIVNVHTTDPTTYESYKRHAQETVAAFGGTYLVRGGKHKVLEGEWNPTRLVLLEFPTYERALAFWESEEYAPQKELRQRISTTEMVLVDGLGGPP